MFLERNVFYLRFGAAKTAVELWRNFLAAYRRDRPDHAVRLWSDLTGPAYTLVLEIPYATYAELEPARCPLTQHPAWKAFYADFAALCERAERTLYRAVEPA